MPSKRREQAKQELCYQEYLKFTIVTRLRLAAAIKLLSRVVMGSPFLIARSKNEAS